MSSMPAWAASKTVLGCPVSKYQTKVLKEGRVCFGHTGRRSHLCYVHHHRGGPVRGTQRSMGRGPAEEKVQGRHYIYCA